MQVLVSMIAGPPARPLRSPGDVTTAARKGQPARVAELAAGGASVNARSPEGGFTALHLAAIRGDVALALLLLDLGADPNILAARDGPAPITAVVHGAPLELLDLLARHGAIATTPNVDGFEMIHAIAKTDRVAYLAWSIAHGSISRRPRRTVTARCTSRPRTATSRRSAR